ncbi:hypothetical protein DFH06DRAFT_1486011, partial [Mycena polygramma]
MPSLLGMTYATPTTTSDPRYALTKNKCKCSLSSSVHHIAIPLHPILTEAQYQSRSALALGLMGTRT